VLLAERRGSAPDGPVVATRWICWQAGELSLERFVARFFDAIAGRVVVGFNSTGFDLPLMELWASRLMLPAPSYFDSPSPRVEARLHCDLQREISGRAGGAGNFDLLCKFHGLPGKPGLSGKDVESLVAQGRLDEVLAYNVTDVMQSYLLLLHVLTRAGRLTRNAATASARASIAVTRTEVTPKLPSGSRALGLLQTSLEACERAPIATER
jgi:predicted PolB exonuclease-like 3'-5' exonuclease